MIFEKNMFGTIFYFYLKKFYRLILSISFVEFSEKFFLATKR